MSQKLTKSQTDKIIAGVCGGLAHYMNADPTLVRVVFAVIVFFTGIVPGIVLYIILALIVPEA